MKKKSVRDPGAESPRRRREALAACGGLVLIAVVAAAPAVAEIPWRSGHTTTRALSTDEIRTSISELAARPEARHIVVQFAQPLEDPQKAALAQAGLNLLAYLSHNAFFVSLADRGVDPDAVAQTRTVIDVRPIARAWKLHPAIIANDYPQYAVDTR